MENQRVRLSKSLLKQALLELLKEKGIEEITVYELCRRAQINRTTFYKYYGSPPALLNEMVQELFDELEKYLSADERSELSILRKAVEYLEKEQDKCRVIINSVSDTECSERLFGLPGVLSMFERGIRQPVTDTQKEYLLLFFCQGGYAIIRRWLNRGCREPAEEIAGLLYSIRGSMLQ